MRTSIVFPCLLSLLTTTFCARATSITHPLGFLSATTTNNIPSPAPSAGSIAASSISTPPAVPTGGCNQQTRQICCPGVPIVPDSGDGLGNHTFAKACQAASSDMYGSDWAKKCDGQWNYTCCQGSSTCEFVPGTGFPFVPIDRCETATESLISSYCQALKTSSTVWGVTIPASTTVRSSYLRIGSWLPTTSTPGQMPGVPVGPADVTSPPAPATPTSVIFEQYTTSAKDPIEDPNTPRNLAKIDPNSWTENLGPLNFEFIAQLFKTTVQDIIDKEVLWRFTECSNQTVQVFVEDCILWDSGLLCEWGWKNFDTGRTGRFWTGD